MPAPPTRAAASSRSPAAAPASAKSSSPTASRFAPTRSTRATRERPGPAAAAAAVAAAAVGRAAGPQDHLDRERRRQDARRRPLLGQEDQGRARPALRRPDPGRLGQVARSPDRRDRPRALLVTRFWYIRSVNPQNAMVTGLTRDGVWLDRERQDRSPGQQLPVQRQPGQSAQEPRSDQRRHPGRQRVLRADRPGDPRPRLPLHLEERRGLTAVAARVRSLTPARPRSLHIDVPDFRRLPN